MQTTTTQPGLNTLETAVLECVAYSDLFDFPLTPDEVQRWLRVPATPDDVVAALDSLTLRPMLSRSGAYVTLAGRESLAQVRDRRRASSAALRGAADGYGSVIARLPFVRMVAVTGSLAVDNADPGDDLDYLIVTAPGRVWTVRAMLMALGRLAALRGVTLCPNYLLAETALAQSQQDFYTARELLQMQPLSGHDTYERMLLANPWWRDHLPNAAPAVSPSPGGPAQSAVERERGPRGEDTTDCVSPGFEGHETPSNSPSRASPSPPAPRPEPVEGGTGLGGGVSPTRHLIEAALRLPPFDALERWILARKGAELRRNAGGPEAVFDETMCKGHADAWRARTQDRLEARMQELGRKLRDSSRNGAEPLPLKLQDRSSNGDHLPGVRTS